jgi:uncharacterized membrane protein YuzA (DUF378 family)
MGDIAKLMMGFAMIAGIAVLIGIVVTGIMEFWPILLGIVAVIFVLYFVRTKARERRNRV